MASYVRGFDSPTSSGYEGKKKPRKRKPKLKKPPAGPFRDESSVPEIRAQATEDERDPVLTAAGEKKKARKLRGVRREARQALRHPALPTIEDTPQFEYTRAKYRGEAPSAKLQRESPRAYEKAFKAFGEFHAERDAVRPDPIAEFAINAAATAGVGAAAGLAAKAGAKGLTALTAKEADSVAKKGAGAVVKATKGTPKQAKKAKKVARTKRGRKNIKRAELSRVGRAGKRAKRKPVRYTGAANAAAFPLGVETPATERANALVEGTGKAIYENPGGTAYATGRGLIGAVTAPIALGAAAVDSVSQGSTAPLKNTAKEQIEGTADLGKQLLSGDTDKVQKLIEDDVGLSPYIGLAAVPRLKVYRSAKGKLRAKAQGARRVAARKTGSDRVRVAPEGVDSHVFGPLERRADRKRGAKRVVRSTNPSRSEAAHYQQRILNELKKAPKPRSLRNVKGMEAGDLLQALAEYGIRTPNDVKFVREHGPTGEVPREGMVTLRTALDFADKHPEILSDKHFKRALDAYIDSSLDLPAAKAGKGRRAKAMAQGDMFGITRPEDRVPVAARAYTKASTRAEAWKQAARREKAIHADRRKGRDLAAQAQVATGAARERLKAEASEFYRSARKAEVVNANLVRALGKYSRPGQALRSSARRKFYDAPLLREYEMEVAAARQKAGLAEPAWTHHGQFKEPGDVGPAYPTAAAGVQHMRSGKLAAEDLVDRSLRSLISGSVVGPRLRAGAQELARRFTTEEMLPVTVGGKRKHLITQKEWADAVRDGQYSPRHHVLFPARQFKQAVLDPFNSQGDMASVAAKALEKGLKQDSPQNKYVVVRREAAKEFQAQINPERWAGEAVVNAASKGASRYLLFSPAWMMIQTVAEAVPMFMAHPELLSPVKVARLEHALRKNQKLRPSEAKAFAAVAGEAPTSLHTPSALRPDLDSTTHGVFSDGARAMTKSKLGQGMFSLIRLRPFGVFDNWRQGKYRELLMAAQADKQLNGWVSSLKGTLKIQKRISDDLRKLPLDQQIAALATPKYRKQLDEMGDHVENIAGNWNTFTRYERNIAPFLVFYPFLRYSLRWPLTFAKQHPVAGTVAQFLSQQNAEQIDKILGRAPDNPLAYALPVVQGADGESRFLPTGQRAAPGLSAPTQAIVSNKPSQALSVFNPLIGAGFTGLTGVNAYTGLQEPERGVQAVDLLLAASPIMRYFEIDSSDLTGLAGIDTSKPQSIASQRYEEIDPNRKQRSLLTPWETISAQQFREGENFSRDLGLKYSDPIPDIFDNPEIGAALYGGKDGKEVDWALVRKLSREHAISEAAADRVLKQEQKFFEDTGSSDFGPERQKAMEMLAGGFFIPTKKKKRKVTTRGIGGGIGGRPIGGSGSGSIGGSSSGSIGGRPVGSIGGP